MNIGDLDLSTKNIMDKTRHIEPKLVDQVAPQHFEHCCEGASRSMHAAPQQGRGV